MQDVSNRLGKISRSWAIGALATVMIVIGNPGTAVAQQITGSISFDGFFTPADNSFATASVDTATAIDWYNNAAQVVSSSGSFAASAPVGSTATLFDFIFNPLASGGVTLWQAGVFSFALNSMSIVTQSAQTLSLVGTGIISGTGFADTAGSWSFTGNQIGRSDFSFSANSVAAVPEPEIYAMMGIGLGVMGWVARRKKQKEALVI